MVCAGVCSARTRSTLQLLAKDTGGRGDGGCVCVSVHISLYVLGAHCNCWPRTRGDVAMELADVLGVALPV